MHPRKYRPMPLVMCAESLWVAVCPRRTPVAQNRDGFAAAQKSRGRRQERGEAVSPRLREEVLDSSQSPPGARRARSLVSAGASAPSPMHPCRCDATLEPTRTKRGAILCAGGGGDAHRLSSGGGLAAAG